MGIRWKTVQPSMGPSHQRGFMGEVCVFIITRSLSEQDMFQLRDLLPAKKDFVQTYSSVARCKEVAGERLTGWLQKSSLKHDN